MPKIAVIEDDDSVRQAFRFPLSSAGFEAVAFPSVEAFIENRPIVACDCLVTELYLPGLSGIDLLERLNGQSGQPPVIIVTAFSTSVNREQARRLGAKAFFAKPVDDQALADAIHWAIEEKDPASSEPQKQS